MKGPNGKVGLESVASGALAARASFARAARAPDARGTAYSDLIVPFGRIVVTADFWTVISVPSDTSTPT